MNDLLVASTDPHMFATFFYGLLDARQATFTCTNAGHNPPVLLRADGTIEELTTGGLLLGMMGEQVYQQDTVELAPGEIIALYTDGITEAARPEGGELRSSRHIAPCSGRLVDRAGYGTSTDQAEASPASKPGLVSCSVDESSAQPKPTRAVAANAHGPSPSCAWVSRPQHHTVPSSRRAHV